jgi:hypothetical protein
LIKDGVEVMMQTALKLLTKEVGRPHLTLLGADTEAEDEEEPAGDL